MMNSLHHWIPIALIQDVFSRPLGGMCLLLHQYLTLHLCTSTMSIMKATTSGWANYFESLGASSNSPMDSNHIHILNVFQSLSTLPSDDPDVFVEDEVAAVIKSLPLRKSAGPDHITYEHLIYAGPILPKVLTILFNAILCSAYIPSTTSSHSPRATTNLLTIHLSIVVFLYYLASQVV